MKKLIGLLLLLPLFASAATSVDTYADMEDSSNGTTLTATIANNGTHGAGTWSVTGTGMKVSTTSEKALRGPVQVVSGSSYNDVGSTRTWQIPNHTALQYAQMSFAGGSKSVVVISGYVTPNQLTSEYNMTDYIVVDGTASGTGYGVFQLENYGSRYGLQLHAQQYVPNAAIYSAWIPVTKGSTYWFTFRCNGTTGLCELEVYDPTTWTLLSPGRVTVTIPVERRSAFGWIKVGRADSHTVGPTATYTYLDDLCVNYTDTTFPFLPAAGPSGDNPPSIVTQPVGTTNSTAVGFTVSVTASGDVPLSYQWRTNLVNISGATSSSYSATPATTNQSGAYTVVITNSVGSITSAVAQVLITNSTVLPPPTIAGIPVERLSTNAWRNAGVMNGIPTRTTISATLNPGATAAQIQSAINACASNEVVYLTAGTYNIGRISIGQKDGWTLRGAGMGQTILNVNTGTDPNVPALSFGVGPTFNGDYSNTVSITAGGTMGSTNITVSSAAAYAVGDIIVMDMVNSGFITNWGSGSSSATDGVPKANNDSAGKNRDGLRVQGHYGRVVAKSGDDLTVWPPIPFDIDLGRTPQLNEFVPGVGEGSSFRGPIMAGVEDLTLVCNDVVGDKNHGINIIATHNFWLKNIEIKNWGGLAAVYARRDSCLEIRGCWIHAPRVWQNSHGYGVQLDPVSGSLIEDNIIYECISNFLLQGGCAGNVIAYNASVFGKYVDGQSYTGQWLQHEISLNHTPFPCYNLMEGNYTAYVQSDYYYGSSGWTTIFRNRLPGNSSATTLHRMCVSIDSNQRYYSVVGNQLGEATAPSSLYLALPNVTRTWTQPGAKTWIYNMLDNGSLNNNYIYRIGYPNSGNNSTNTTWPPFQYKDFQTITSTVINANWDAKNLAVVYDASGDTSVPDSFYLDAKPDFFAGLEWPPYGPSTPDGTSNEIVRIPAGWRLVKNESPPAVTPPTNAPVITQANASGTVGTYFVYTAAATHTPITGWGASNLPTGLTMSGAVISGTPTTAETNVVTLYATNAAGNASATVTFSIEPQITLSYLGNTNTGAYTDILNANDISGAQYTALGSFVVSNINAYVSTSTGYWKAAIYSSSSNLLGYSDPITNTEAGWTSFPLVAPVSITNGSIYWMHLWSSATAYAFYSDASTHPIRYETRAIGAWPAVLVLTNSGASLNYSIYADGADFEGPVLTITTPVSGISVLPLSINISGTASDSSGVATVTATNLATGLPITITGTETWSGTTELRQGGNILEVTATDTLGNQRVATTLVQRDFGGDWIIGTLRLP